jgi:hypothetical protein
MSSSGNKTVSVGMTTELIRGDVFQKGRLRTRSLHPTHRKSGAHRQEIADRA